MSNTKPPLRIKTNSNGWVVLTDYHCSVILLPPEHDDYLPRAIARSARLTIELEALGPFHFEYDLRPTITEDPNA